MLSTHYTTARDEVKNQNVMLDSLGTKIDSVHEHVSNMNEKLKETIEKVFVIVCMYVMYMYPRVSEM